MFGAAFQQFQHVWHQFHDSIQRLNRAFGGARKIDDQDLAARPGQRTREHSQRCEFAAPGAPPLDFVFTVCDNAAGEVCPYWPGQPMTAHWGIPDPAALEGADVGRWIAFRSAFKALEYRIKIFASLPFAALDQIRLQERLDAIGKATPPEGPT